MDKISIEQKTNFFEHRPTEYAKNSNNNISKVNITGKIISKMYDYVYTNR